MAGWSKDLDLFLPILFKGAAISVLITLLAMATSSVAGFGVCLLRVARSPLLQKPATLYINIIRGTPLLVQLFYVYFVFPELGVELSAFQASIVGLTLCYAAYHAEIFRAGILSVDRGEIEAAYSLGMRPRQVMGRVILPQAARVILPPMGSSFITLLKDSSLTATITVRELTRSGQLLAATTFQNMKIFTLVALIYIALSAGITRLIAILERHYGKR